MPSLTRTRNACLASAEQDARKTYFVTTSEGSRTIEISKCDLDFFARRALIERVRRTEVAENVGSIGVFLAAFSVVSLVLAALPPIFTAVFP